jgi:hypothetical protein
MLAGVRVLFLLVAALTLRAGEGIEQPLPFSHKQHAGTLKVACKMCHPSPDPGESMTIVGAGVCMQCHSAIKTDRPAIQKLAQYAREQRPIPWVRIYEIPSYVSFSHRTHLEAKNSCEECHGKVVERDQLWKQGDISMGGCMKCHQAKKVSIDCTFCHEPR